MIMRFRDHTLGFVTAFKDLGNIMGRQMLIKLHLAYALSTAKEFGIACQGETMRPIYKPMYRLLAQYNGAAIHI